MEINEKKKNEILLTTSSDNSIISNDNHLPDENNIKKQLILYNKELYKNREINFEDIMKNYIGIASLILSKKNNPTLDLMNHIIILIKSIDKYKNFPNEKILKDLENFYKKLTEKEKKQKEMITLKTEKRENVFNRLYSKRKNFRIEIKTLRKNKSCSIQKREIFEKLFDYCFEKKNCYHNNSIQKNKINMSYKSKKILYNKYKIQFKKSLIELYKENKINNIDKLNYNEFIFFTKKLGFLKNEDNETEINLIKKMYDYLRLNKIEKYILVKKFFKFSLSILNLNFPKKIENNKINNEIHKRKSFSSTSSSSRSPINKLTNNLKLNSLIIDSNQSKKIYNDYKILYDNFKNNNNKLKENNNNNLFNKLFTFKPVLNDKFNIKVKGNLFSHISKFENMKEINKTFLKNEKLKIETQECTFKPQLTNYKRENSKKNIEKKINEIDLSINNYLKEFKPNSSLNRNYLNKKNSFYNKRRENSLNNISKIRNKYLDISNKNIDSFKEMKRIRSDLFKKEIPNKNLKKAILSLENNSFNKEDLKNEKEKNYINKSRNKKDKNLKKKEIIKKKINRSYDKELKKEQKIKRNISYSKSKNETINYHPINKENNLLNSKPLFILDINLTNRNKKIYIYKGININKTIEDFVKENKIDDPKNVEFIRDLIQIELNKFK